MATSFAEAFKGINFENLEEGKEMTEEEFKNEKQIEFLEGWLKLQERNASSKEKFRYAQEHGFVSETHLNMCLAAQDDYDTLKEEFEVAKEFLSKEQIREYQEKLNTQEYMAVSIKNKRYYKMIMKLLKRKDVSPYGEDLLKSNIHDNEDRSVYNTEKGWWFER